MRVREREWRERYTETVRDKDRMRERERVLKKDSRREIYI